jgi:hypothetical protein
MAKSASQKRREAKAKRKRKAAKQQQAVASVAPLTQGGHDDKTNDHAEHKPDYHASGKSLAKKGNIMSGWVFAVASIVCGLAFTVGIGLWLKGGYDNIRTGFYGIVVAGVAFAVALPSGYWHYVVKPAQIAANGQQQPSVAVKLMTLLAPLTVGQYPTVRIIYVNGPKVPINGFASYARLVLYNKPIADAIRDFPVGDFKSNEIGNVLVEGQERVVDYPQTTLVIETKDLIALNARLTHLYVIGKAYYRANGREYSFPFYAVYDPSDGGFNEP